MIVEAHKKAYKDLKSKHNKEENKDDKSGLQLKSFGSFINYYRKLFKSP